MEIEFVWLTVVLIHVLYNVYGQYGSLLNMDEL